MKKGLLLVIIAYLGFISLGLPDGLLGVAWPSIRATFDIPLDALGALLITTTLGYLLSSFNSGRIVNWMGVGGLLTASSLITATGLLGYVFSPAWAIMVACGLLAGLGAGAIDAGLNAYAAYHFSARHVNWLHASFGVGTTLGPIIMTTVLSLNQGWQWGYVIVATIQIGLAVCFGFTLNWWQDSEADPEGENSRAAGVQASSQETLKIPTVWISMILFLLYSGTEVTAGQWSYTLFTEGRGITPEVAGIWVGLYWGSLTVGRLLMGLFVEWIGPIRLVRFSLLGATAGAVLLWLNLHQALSFLGLALIGFSLAPIYPSLISTTPARLGPVHATNAIGFQVSMAGMSIAVLPTLAGVLADAWSLEIIGPFLAGGGILMFFLHEQIAWVRYEEQPQSQGGK